MSAGEQLQRVELTQQEFDIVEHVLEDRAEQEQYGAVPTDNSMGLNEIVQKIRDQRTGDSA